MFGRGKSTGKDSYGNLGPVFYRTLAKTKNVGRAFKAAEKAAAKAAKKAKK